MIDLSFIIPTRNRPEALAHTLARLAALRLTCAAEVIIIDNASDPPAAHGTRLDNGIEVHGARREDNLGAAARNLGATLARGSWLMMLDDDSAPLDEGFESVMADAPADLAAIGADIRLPSGAREAGGLPEVIIGCGALVRRDRFLEVGGYDASFHYYVEEYDLCAQLIRTGARIEHDPRFRVGHRKLVAGRDMNVILQRLVRNNGWVMQRYAPDAARNAALAETIRRYAEIATREDACTGYEAGLTELHATLDAQPRRTMTAAQYDRFTGRAATRAHLRSALTPGTPVAIVERGKNAWAIEDALAEHGCPLVPERDARHLIIGTLSPGPMLDGVERRRARGHAIIEPCCLGPAGAARIISA